MADAVVRVIQLWKRLVFLFFFLFFFLFWFVLFVLVCFLSLRFSFWSFLFMICFVLVCLFFSYWWGFWGLSGFNEGLRCVFVFFSWWFHSEAKRKSGGFEMKLLYSPFCVHCENR